MSAYIFIEARILDEAVFKEYVAIAEPSVSRFGGKYLAASDQAVAVEGMSPIAWVYLAEFPSIKHLNDWYASPDYQRARKLVPQALDRRMIFVDGMRAD